LTFRNTIDWSWLTVSLQIASSRREGVAAPSDSQISWIHRSSESPLRPQAHEAANNIGMWRKHASVYRVDGTVDEEQI
jgi:hypothetical protein